MTGLAQSFDTDLWRWELTSDGSQAGPAGVASVELGGGITAHVDGLDGRLLRLDADADDERGMVSVVAEEVLRSLGLDRPREAGTVTLADDVAALMARLAVLEAERSHAEALGPASGAWAAEAAALRAQLGLPDASPTAAPAAPAADALELARDVLRDLPTLIGRLAVDGPVAVEPSWITPGVLDLRRVRTTALPGSTEVTVNSLVRDGIYAAAITGISAALVEDSTGIVVGVAPFAYELVDGRPAAAARVMVGAGRPSDSVSLWLTSDPARLPSPRLLSARRAAELGRRAAQAQRLGLGDDATALLDASRAEWARIDRTHPPSRPMSAAPFAGEVDDLAAVGDDEN